jgi:hypothetical protein
MGNYFDAREVGPLPQGWRGHLHPRFPGVPLPVPAGTIMTLLGESEITQLETMKTQAACGLNDAHWDTSLPKLYTWMLEEGRTTARVKALLEDVFQPDDMYSLTSVHLGVTTDMAKGTDGPR